MKRWLFLLIVMMVPRLVGAAEIWLKVGEVRAVHAGRGAKVRVGARGIVRVIDGDKVVRLVALKPGSTSLVIDEQAYSVRVSPAGQKEFIYEFGKAVRGMMGLRMSVEGAHVFIDGTLLRFEDWQDLADIARRHQGQYSFRAQALPDVASAAMAFLQNMAQERGFPILRFTASPEFTAVLPAAASGLRTAVERSLGPFGIRLESSDSTLSIEPLVKTQVILAEVENSFSRQFGVQWPSFYDAQVLPRLSADAALMATLKALEQKGQAQILASPNLLCRSGSEAQFHAGGEFPIKVVSRHFEDVVWKQHGVLLKVKPRADFQGAISLEIETEVSLLDQAHAVDGIPALKVNKVKSHFDLPGKRTIALSGLLRQELSDSSEGLPLLSSIPILGPLFSSKNFQNHRSELVVFVTPEIHSPEVSDKVEMPAGWVRDER
jgi:pilus assembly protein CpaC